MKVLVTIAAIFVAGIYGMAGLKNRERRETKLSPSEMTTLQNKYTLNVSPLGGFLAGQTWKSDKMVGSSPEAAAYLVVVNGGVCGQFNTFTKDRLYVWHNGNAMIDIFFANGTHTPKCLGDPLDDTTCNYEVYIPAGTTANIRPQDHAVFTGLVFLGTVADGSKRTYEEVLAEFPSHSAIIELTQPCYST